MSVRVYDFAHKFGLTSKQVIEEANKHGIKVKVPSSAIDKITAEWFEQQLIAAGFKPVVEKPPETPTTEAPAASPTPGTDVPAVPAPEIATTVEPAVKPELLSLSPVITAPNATATPATMTPDHAAIIFTPGALHAPAAPAPKPTIAPERTVPIAPRAPLFRPGRAPTRISSHATGSRGAPTTEPGATPADVGKETPAAEPQTFEKSIHLKPPIIVKELAKQLSLKPFQLIHDLMEMNIFAAVNQAVDEEVARKICARHGFGFEVERRRTGDAPTQHPIKKPEPVLDEMQVRPPVVTILGHVDHGKTSLLDAIRKTNVVAGEAGGITQHIGAYTITIKSGGRDRRITFLDTPGHEAFTKMRARGANVTDIAVLVVGADDGVQPQTIESINHARAAKVPIIVALNKMDKPTSDPLKVKKQLQAQDLQPEEWGGQTIVCEVSALAKTGIDHLLEMIILQADMLDLKANAKTIATGTVIEAALESGRGPVATFLVRNGTLKVGQALIAGTHWGKVRAMTDQSGLRLKEAGPSTAVQVLGLSGVPEAGIEFKAMPNDKEVRALADERELTARAGRQATVRPRVTMETLFQQIADDQRKELKIVLKADVQGSLEAIGEALGKLPTDKINFTVIHAAVGNITESDALLASASDALIIGFHVRPEPGVNDLAAEEEVEIRLYSIIYELIDDARKVQEGLLEPVLKEIVIGHAEIRQVFELSKGVVAGCIVSDGRIIKNGRARLLRRNMKEYQGTIGTLRRFQDDVNEVRAGLECGIRLADFTDYETGDVIECYQIEKIAQKL